MKFLVSLHPHLSSVVLLASLEPRCLYLISQYFEDRYIFNLLVWFPYQRFAMGKIEIRNVLISLLVWKYRLHMHEKSIKLIADQITNYVPINSLDKHLNFSSKYKIRSVIVWLLAISNAAISKHKNLTILWFKLRFGCIITKFEC